MRLNLLFVALALLAASSAAQGGSGPDYRLFALGNSLTDELRYDDFVEMCVGGGKEVVLARQTVPGAPIGWLREHNHSGGRVNISCRNIRNRMVFLEKRSLDSLNSFQTAFPSFCIYEN